MPALLAAFIGALAAYIIDIRRFAREQRADTLDSAKERRRLRSTVATSLLIDLRRVESLLRQLYFAPTAGNTAFPDLVLFYDVFRSELRHFAASSIYPINEAFERYRHAMGILQELRGTKRPASASDHYAVSALAGFALQSLPLAVNALVAEGGEITTIPASDLVTSPTLPAIPERQFTDTPDVGHAAAALAQPTAATPAA